MQGAVRELAAIMAIDVVGFSRLIEAHEARTLDSLRTLQDTTLAPLIGGHRGRVVKLMGDGVLAVFGSVVDAVQCAAAIQERPVAPVDGDGDGRALPLVLRIGVHVGDIVLENGDIMGDGVNLAARLEQLCPPGAVAMSGEAYDHLQGKTEAVLRFVGKRQVKNVARAIRVYVLEPKGFQAGRRPWLSVAGRPRWSRAAALGAMLALVVAGAAIWQAGLPPFHEVPTAVTSVPTVAVLPFENASGDASRSHVSDGIAEEILIALARSPLLQLVGRNTTLAAAQGSSEPREIGARLGASYLVSGRAQWTDDRLRLTARLTDARSGSDLWAESFDRPLSDVFAVQDEIAGLIAARLGARVQKAEESAVRAQPPAAAFGAYEKVLLARSIRHTDAGKEATLRARQLLREAIDADPASALAHAELGYTYYREIARRWDQARKDEAVANGLAAAEEALRLDPSLSFANVTMGNLLVRSGDFTSAEIFMRRAIALNPSDPEAHAGLANVLLFVNRALEALPLIDRAVALDPLYPALYDSYRGKGLVLAGRHAEAIPVLKECLRRLPDSWPCYSYLAAAYHFTGEGAAATAAFERMGELAPFKSLAQYRSMVDNQPGPQSDRMLEALAALGLPPD